MSNRPSATFHWLVLSFIVLLQACVTDSLKENEPLADTIIENVTTIDAKNGVRHNVSVLISGDTISGLYAKGVEASSDSELIKNRIDGTGKYLIPGLWDAHVHLTFDEKVTRSMNRLFVANGVTSVRDTGGLLELMLAAKKQASKEVAPNIYFAGPLLDGVPTVYGGDAPGFPKIAKTVATVEEAEAEVDRLVAAGASLIKAYEMLSPEVFKAVLRRAEHHNLPVTGHVPLSMTATQASAAGLRSMEHMRNLELGCASNEEELLGQRIERLKNPNNKLGSSVRTHIHGEQRSSAVSAFDEEKCNQLVAELVKNDTWQIPTMALNMWVQNPYYGDAQWQSTYDGLPQSVAKDWIDTGNAVAAGMAGPSTERTNLLKHADWQVAMLQRLVKAEVTIMAGTDTPIYYLTPGYSLHLELETLVEKGGMTPLQAIEAATLTPARYFNLQDKMGAIDQGMIADLILLDESPMEAISNTTKIQAVFLGGQLFNRKALDHLLKAE